MWNSVTAIAAAAAIAAVATLLSAPAAEVAAKIPAASEPTVQLRTCAELAWPYSRCGDGRLVARGANIRLVTSDRLPAN